MQCNFPTSMRLEQWGDGFEVEALINVRVAASNLKIAEVGSYEKARIYGSSNLRAVTDGMRVLRTICKEFVWPTDQKEAANARTPLTIRESTVPPTPILGSTVPSRGDQGAA